MRMRLSIDGEWFIDDKGRKVLLRGVNLSGSSKMPTRPNGATHLKTDFHDHKEVSFVGRPFPLREADEHLERIKHWGFNAIRFLVTWEAIEHAGPGHYDTEYLDYVEEVMKVIDSNDLHVIVDPHQDVWSRMCGGDGAPGWTFEVVGIDFTKFDETGAATLMQHRYDPNDPKAFGPLSWSQNRVAFGSCTMWTLFFGGAKFAPSCTVNGTSAQTFLQEHFTNALTEVARRVRDLDCVLGFEPINEPNQGWIGSLVDGSDSDLSEVLGHAYTPIDAMLTASGHAREISFREVKRLGIKETRRDLINPDGGSVWLDGSKDIWKNEGIWTIDPSGVPQILKNEHFTGTDFYRDHLSPFILSYTDRIREVFPEVIIFVQAPFEPILKGQVTEFQVPPNSVHAPHWFDVATMGMKRFMGKASYDIMKGTTVIGGGRIRRMFTEQLEALKLFTKKITGETPTVIGEMNLCFDLDKKKAYEEFQKNPAGAWKTHIQALNTYYQSLDKNLLHAFHWNYTPDNDNTWGDQWNLEDFSIFSKDQRTEPTDIDSGGRALQGFCRPRFIHLAGTPHFMEFDLKNGSFQLEFEGISTISAPTIIYIPKVQFPEGFVVETENAEVEQDLEKQFLLISSVSDGTCSVLVRRKGKFHVDLDDDEPDED
jgi:hypothetical protein